jgi:NADPH:quinone reductase-like Zn-dependent oxidoreductase
MSKAIRFYEPGPADVQRLDDIEVPAPGAGEVRIRVQAIGLNRSDLTFRSGQHPTKPFLPSGNGAEAAGIIESVGAQVREFAPGDAVVVVPHMNPERGTYGELIVIAADRVMKAAPQFDSLQNAAFWASYLTAYGGMIQVGQLAAGDYVVLPAAASSVGLAALQIANAIGAIPIGLSRSADKLPQLRAAGAHHALLSTRDDLASELMRCTGGRGARVIFDPVGGAGALILAQAMAQHGRYVLYGVLSGENTPFPLASAFDNLLSMMVFRLDFVNHPENLPAGKAFLDHHIARGTLNPKIDKIFAFDEVIAAHRYMEQDGQFGKIVMRL